MTQQAAAQTTENNQRKKGFTHHNLDVRNIQTRVDNGEKLFVTAFATRQRRVVDGEPRKGTAFKIRANGDFARQLLAIKDEFGTDENGIVQKKLNVYGVYEKAEEWNGNKTDVITLFDIYDPEVRAAEKTAKEAAEADVQVDESVRSVEAEVPAETEQDQEVEEEIIF